MRLYFHYYSDTTADGLRHRASIYFHFERQRRRNGFAYRFVNIGVWAPGLNNPAHAALSNEALPCIMRWYQSWPLFLAGLKSIADNAMTSPRVKEACEELRWQFTTPPTLEGQGRSRTYTALELTGRTWNADNYTTMAWFLRDVRNGAYGTNRVPQPRRPRRPRRPTGRIYGYGFRPSPRFQIASGEPGATTREYLGVEIEVDSREAPSSSRADIARCAHAHLGDVVYVKADGSLNYGAEIVSHPGTLAWWNTQREKVGAMFRELVGLGWRSHNTSTAGLHVHVSRRAFDNAQHLYRWLHLIYRNKAMTLYISQRNPEMLDRWASLTANDRRNLKQKAGLLSTYGRGRYEAVNPTEHTMEVRIFRGTLLEDRFYKALQFVSGGIAFAREVTSLRRCTAKGFKEWVAVHKAEYPDLDSFLNESTEWLAQSRTDEVARSFSGLARRSLTGRPAVVSGFLEEAREIQRRMAYTATAFDEASALAPYPPEVLDSYAVHDLADAPGEDSVTGTEQVLLSQQPMTNAEIYTAVRVAFKRQCALTFLSQELPRSLLDRVDEGGGGMTLRARYHRVITLYAQGIQDAALRVARHLRVWRDASASAATVAQCETAVQQLGASLRIAERDWGARMIGSNYEFGCGCRGCRDMAGSLAALSNAVTDAENLNRHLSIYQYHPLTINTINANAAAAIADSPTNANEEVSV